MPVPFHIGNWTINTNFRNGRMKLHLQKNEMNLITLTVLVVILSVNSLAAIIDIPYDFPSIQEGIDVCEDGDTVIVQPGIYYENINFNGHNIVLGSLFLITDDDVYISSTVIDGSRSGSVITFENDEDSTAVITGFTIRHGATHDGGGIYCVNSNPTISANIIIRNNAIGGIHTSGKGGGIFCKCLAYITARAIQHRLDDVCGIENWRNEQPVMIAITEMKNAFACGISIRPDDGWLTE